MSTAKNICFFRGQFNKALDLTESFPDGANKTFGQTVIYHAMGRQGESDAAMMQLTNDPGRQVPYLIALVHAMRGEPDQAFEWLDTPLPFSFRQLQTLPYFPPSTSHHPPWSY